MAAAQSHTIDLPALDLRAAIGSIDETARTAEVIFSTGAPVERYDWSKNERYIEMLSLKPAHVRLARLNTAGPLLDAHSAWSITDQIGIVVADSARIVGGIARATVKFSRREAVAGIWQDVIDGVLRSLSVGYRVFQMTEDRSKDGAMPTRTAIDWEPYEISLVPMPADVGARIRSGDKTGTNVCAIERAHVIPDADRSRRLKFAIANSRVA